MKKRPRKSIPRDSRGRFISPKRKPKKRKPQRDSRGRFISASQDSKPRKPVKPTKSPKRGKRKRKLPTSPLAGRVVINHFTGEVFSYDRAGRLRDAAGHFAKRTDMPTAEADGRVRTDRMTFDEAIEFYDFEGPELPDWILYLEGAP